MLTLRPVRAEELEEVWALVQRAVAHMISIGNPQWGPLYPTHQHFVDDIADGILWGAWGTGGELLGVAAIVAREEPDYAPVAWRLPEPAVVIHRLAIDPDVQRQGVASAFFDKAGELAGEIGAPSLRIDTFSLNFRMQALIQKRGYVRVGQVQFSNHTLPSYCYEKAAGALPCPR